MYIDTGAGTAGQSSLLVDLTMNALISCGVMPHDWVIDMMSSPDVLTHIV